VRKTRIGRRNGSGVTVDHRKLDKDISLELYGVSHCPCIYLDVQQAKALVRTLQRAIAEAAKSGGEQDGHGR